VGAFSYNGADFSAGQCQEEVASTRSGGTPDGRAAGTSRKGSPDSQQETTDPGEHRSRRFKGWNKLVLPTHA